MTDTMKKLKKEELKVGMHVSSEQLSNIFNYYIILQDASVTSDGYEIEGTIAWHGEEMTAETDIYNNMPDIAIINNLDDTTDGEVYYDEEFYSC